MDNLEKNTISMIIGNGIRSKLFDAIFIEENNHQFNGASAPAYLKIDSPITEQLNIIRESVLDDIHFETY